MEIDGITLWALGGVARFKGRFPSAPAELRIALAGPAVSLALGVVLLAAALLLPLPSAVDGVAHWLGTMNLVLVGFNMLPALPLDGGRVLRAVLWQRHGDLGRATRTAADVGRAGGQLMIAVGLSLALLGGGIGGLWLAIIGWFLLSAGGAEATAARQELALDGRTVADAMVRRPVSVPATMSLDAFVEVVLAHRHTAYPVVDDGRLVGLVSFRSLPVRIERLSVADVMVPVERVATVPATMPLADALPVVLGAPLRRALVRDGADWALLSPTDALRVLEVLDVAGRRAARPGAPLSGAAGR
ncbi:MAG TPA: site-2 protease family protein, partial [Baekduia sp.]|nr:site-2 protease family protein [Baekduia sp.]